MGLVVGFDLDMTLLDTRPGIAATYRALIEVTGVPIDVEAAVGRLGPPLTHELANWFPAEEIPQAITTYRALYRTHAIERAVPLPGALAAVAAVRAAGGRVVVITAKLGSLARLHLDRVGMVVDEVHGDVFADGKEQALRATAADVYVGDHVADMVAAVRASAGRAGGPVTRVGVTTGPCEAAELTAAGADLVVASLTELPAWLAARRTDTGCPTGCRQVDTQQAHR